MATGFRHLTVYKKAFALACEYIPKEIFDDFTKLSEEIGRLLNHMIQNPEKYKKPSLQIADCRLKIADLIMQSIIKLAIINP